VSELYVSAFARALCLAAYVIFHRLLRGNWRPILCYLLAPPLNISGFPGGGWERRVEPRIPRGLDSHPSCSRLPSSVSHFPVLESSGRQAGVKRDRHKGNQTWGRVGFPGEGLTGDTECLPTVTALCDMEAEEG
jgi:hypothetical protein